MFSLSLSLSLSLSAMPKNCNKTYIGAAIFKTQDVNNSRK